MPQARLPDINTAFNTHRKRAIMAMESHNWTEAIGALYCINAALPAEEDKSYRVIISTKQYNELTKQDLLATCNNCKEEIDYNEIKILNILTTPLQRFITRTTAVKIWVCPKCKKDNILGETSIEQTILAQPYYLGVVPKPPARTDNITSHIRYDRELERWCWTMLGELEQNMAQYREDNWKRDDGEENMGQIDTSLDEQDDPD